MKSKDFNDVFRDNILDAVVLSSTIFAIVQQVTFCQQGLPQGLWGLQQAELLLGPDGDPGPNLLRLMS